MIEVENDYQKKLMVQSFPEQVTLASKGDVLKWRSAWMQALGSWHSPYKLVIDANNLTINGSEAEAELGLMLRFFEGFFLRKAVAWGITEDRGAKLLPIPVCESADDAFEKIGVRKPAERKPGDFRSSIQIQNHFRQHVVEVNFADPVVVNSNEQVTTLKSKLTNNLMQWHSKWSLLIDCGNLTVDPSTHEEWAKMERSLRGFFLKQIIGYSPVPGEKDNYPFAVYRARHRAAAILEGEGNFSGDEADCKSRKPGS